VQAEARQLSGMPLLAPGRYPADHFFLVSGYDTRITKKSYAVL